MKRARMICILEPVFHVPVVMIWNATDAQFCATLKKNLDIEVEEMLTGAGVFFAHEREQGTLAIIGISDKFEGTPYNYAILSHEVIHASLHMLKDRGLPYSTKTEEALCYLSSFLVSTLAEEMLKVETKLERRRKARANG